MDTLPAAVATQLMAEQARQDAAELPSLESCVKTALCVALQKRELSLSLLEPPKWPNLVQRAARQLRKAEKVAVWFRREEASGDVELFVIPSRCCEWFPERVRVQDGFTTSPGYAFWGGETNHFSIPLADLCILERPAGQTYTPPLLEPAWME